VKRKQLYLPEALDAELARRARASGVAEAEIVREALRRLFGEAEPPPDPLLAVVGMARARPGEP